MGSEQTPAAQWADLWAVYMRENRALTARAEAAEQRAEGLATEVARLRGAVAAADALLSDGLEIVESLSAGHDVWAEQVRAALGGAA